MIVAEGDELTFRVESGRVLQWGRNLIVAEGMNNTGSQSRGRPLQWGRNLIVAEGAVIMVKAAYPDVASMGPQLDSCGRKLVGHLTAHVAHGLQWGRNLIVAEGGAAALQFMRRKAELQWGRNLIVAEGSENLFCLARQTHASMGPQLDSCGRRACYITGVRRKGFTGAATW